MGMNQIHKNNDVDNVVETMLSLDSPRIGSSGM